MQRAFVVRGRLTGKQTVVLAEPVEGVELEVEVLVREVAKVALPPDVTESPVAILRRDVIDAALAGAPPQLEVVYERGEPDGSNDTGMIVARRRSPSANPEEGEHDTDPRIPLPPKP